MNKNVTLKIDESLLRKCRRIAVEKDKSLSQWITDLLVEVVTREERFARARAGALKRLQSGFRLGGRPLSRQESHER